MKFRNPKTGDIYDFEGKSCVTSGFCSGVSCLNCPVRRNRGLASCRYYVLNNPNTAAALMGYEVIEDDIPAPEYDPQDVAFKARHKGVEIDPVKPLEIEEVKQGNLPKEISHLITGDELLRQTAEEAAELAQAALKVIRAAKGTTPLDGETTVDRLVEEIADVQNCIAVLSVRLPDLRSDVDKIAAIKMERWRGRLK